MLVSQPGHWGAYGSDCAQELPLLPGSGWIFPAGLDGACSWKGPQAIINVSLPKALFAEDGMADITDFTVGELDPLTAELIFALHAADEASPALYRESLTTALAAHLAQAQVFAKRQLESDRRIRRAVDFIATHLEDDLSLGCSPLSQPSAPIISCAASRPRPASRRTPM